MRACARARRAPSARRQEHGGRRGRRRTAPPTLYKAVRDAAGHTATPCRVAQYMQSMLLCAGRHLFYIELHERNARSSCSELTDRTRLCRRIEVRALWRRRRRSAGVWEPRGGAHTRLSIYQQKTSPPRSWRLHTGCLRPHLLPPPTKSSKNLFTFAVNESPS